MNKALQAARARANLTQAQLAQKAGISTSGYQKYELEQREPRLQIAICIAKVLNSTVEALFLRKEGEDIEDNSGTE